MTATLVHAAAATREITPRRPLRLAGFASRTTDFEDVAEPIHLTALALSGPEAEEPPLVLIAADLICWNPSLLVPLRARLEAETGLPAWRFVFSATHNHSGPATGADFLPSIGIPDPEYLELLCNETAAAVREALTGRRPLRLSFAETTSNIGVYRRGLRNGRMMMAPNYDVPIDRRLSLLRLVDPETGELAVGMIHFACHASVTADNRLSGDYPGALLNKLRAEHPGSHWLFLQGSCGDIRANVVIGDLFSRCDQECMRRFAARLGESLAVLLNSAPPDVNLQSFVPRLLRSQVELPLTELVTREELEADVDSSDPSRADRARRLLARLNAADSGWGSRTLDIALLQIAPDLALFMLAAEVCGAYGDVIRRAGALRGLTILPVSCSEGMVGYVATASQIAEGGYEPRESAWYFALEGTYDSVIESRITAAIQSLIERL
ncbi:MAG: hypothetical protein QM296_02935 [Bacillota bacterium]|nr:hypothetical protein [Bacillota bacterium]